MKAIGAVVAVFGDLEQVLWLTPKRILNITLKHWKNTLADPEAERLKSIPYRVTAIRQTYRQHYKVAVPKDLDALLKDTKRVNNDRHDVIHALWARDMEGNVVRIRLGKRLSTEISAVVDLAARTRQVRDQINDYHWPQPG